MESGKDDNKPGSLMSCLIEKKHYSDMNEKCRAGVEHHQLVCSEHALANHLSLCLSVYVPLCSFVCLYMSVSLLSRY